MTGSIGPIWLLRQRNTFESVTHALQPKAPLENIVAMHPLELVHIDYLCLEPRIDLKENVLVVMDHFMQYTQAYVTQSQTTQITVKVLWDKFIVHYAFPEKSCQIRIGISRVSWWMISVS